jgi:hypothetical protein
MLMRLRRRLPMPKLSSGRPRAHFALTRFIELAREYKLTGACIDVGAGPGHHVTFLKQRGPFAEVHGLDPGARAAISEDRLFRGTLEEFRPDRRYDAIWCCHTLEHSPNPGLFLRRLRRLAAPGALICVTVPPLRHDNTIGHLTMWNAGTLLINLVHAGFDCASARVKKSGYNISVILRNEESGASGAQPPGNSQARFRARMPASLRWRRSWRGTWYFNGNIRSLNWE